MGVIVTTIQGGVGFGDEGYGDGLYGGTVGMQVVQYDPAQPIDHTALGLSRVIAQFKNSPKFIAYLTALLNLANDVEETLQSLYLLPDIDSMTGVNLDVIGRIVGITRDVPNIVAMNYFGFAGEYYELTFGELGDPSIGARFYELGEAFSGSTTLADPEFRLLIKAKILRNQSSGTGEDILAAMSSLFSTEQVNVIDNGGMECDLYVGRGLTATELAIISQIDILPRPSGVRFGVLTTPNGTLSLPVPV